MLGVVDKLQAIAKAPAAPPVRQPAVVLEDVPPPGVGAPGRRRGHGCSRRAPAVDGGDGAGCRGRCEGAFEMAAQIARETASDVSLKLQVARSTLRNAVREEIEKPERSEALDGIRLPLQKLQD